jgi:hypothetical protein
MSIFYDLHPAEVLHSHLEVWSRNFDGISGTPI